jgi:hypothetical protein
MVKVLSIHVWIQNFENCLSYFKKGMVGGKIMEGMNPCI